MEVFVGNLDYGVTEDELRDLFFPFGETTRIFIPYDRTLERPRGYGFITMADAASGEKAIVALNGTVFRGRTLRVARGTKTHRLF